MGIFKILFWGTLIVLFLVGAMILSNYRMCEYYDEEGLNVVRSILTCEVGCLEKGEMIWRNLRSLGKYDDLDWRFCMKEIEE